MLGDLSYYSNINIERSQEEGILVACTQYADDFNFDTYLFTESNEVMPYSESVRIHKGNLLWQFGLTSR